MINAQSPVKGKEQQVKKNVSVRIGNGRIRPYCPPSPYDQRIPAAIEPSRIARRNGRKIPGSREQTACQDTLFLSEPFFFGRSSGLPGFLETSSFRASSADHPAAVPVLSFFFPGTRTHGANPFRYFLSVAKSTAYLQGTGRRTVETIRTATAFFLSRRREGKYPSGLPYRALRNCL